MSGVRRAETGTGPGATPTGRVWRVLLHLGLALSLLHCSGGEEERVFAASPPGPAEHFVLIGLDGANWGILEPLIASGRVPFLASLVESGVSGILWSKEPTSTPVVWTTILTGLPERAHGIEGFTTVDAASGRVVPVRSTDRRVPAIWSYLDHFGKSVGIVGAYATWPAEPVEGFVVSRLVREPATPGATHPPSLARRAKSVDPEGLAAILAGWDSGATPINDFKRDTLSSFWSEDHAALELGIEAAVRTRPDFLFIYSHMTDIAQHNLWPPGVEPRPGVDLEPFEGIFRVYEHLDRRLEELVDRIATPRTAVMVVSDHGARGTGAVHLYRRHTDRLLELLGLLRFQEGGEGIDLERSLVVPGPASGPRVRLQVNRRNPELAEPEARRRIARDLEERLRDLELGGSGRRVFRKVEPHPEDPDVVVAVLNVRPEDEDAVVSIDGQRIPIRELYHAGSVGGGHTVRGIVIAAGPPFRSARLLPGTPGSPERIAGPRSFRVIDVAPTVLSAMGLPVPEAMEGRVLTGLFAPGFAAGRDFRPEVVDLDWEPPRPPEGRGAAEALNAVTEQLRAIGYVE